MKKQTFSIFLVVALIAGIVLPSVASPKREHRSSWCSAYVNDWPSSPITEGNMSSHKRVCDKIIDSLVVNNYTSIYYHVRAMCDAMYDSKYEPWSRYLSGTRGVKPAFDPLAYLLEKAHANGIEVYAWINPYRYSNTYYDSTHPVYGSSPLDYEKSHPDWLLSNVQGAGSPETILNPALPQVRQRIVDVCADILSKYDVDGVVFDDYFYNNGGLPYSQDAKWYNQYKANGGKLNQGDWRRENVNQMVRDVNNYLKQNKPWVRFGISPAGVAGKSASKYGLRPCPGSDWQYGTIYSDPLAWLNDGSIDFISPQVYWPIGGNPDFQKVTEWWGEVAHHFNRHVYISQSLYRFGDTPFEDYAEEINVTRNTNLDAAPGLVYFKTSDLIWAGKSINRKPVKFMNYLKSHVYQYKSLTPEMSWSKNSKVTMPSNVKMAGSRLSWDGPENCRFVVYAFPKSMAQRYFNRQQEYILFVPYTKYFDLTAADKDKYNYAVSTLNRFGFESSAVFVGSKVEAAPAVKITSPAEGTNASGLIRFAWQSEATSFNFEVAKNAAITDVVFVKETTDKYLLSTEIQALEEGVTYYCRVTSKASNCTDSYSQVVSFSISPLKITEPADKATEIGLTPVIRWNKVNGATYKVAIATNELMQNPVIEATARTNVYSVPKYKLAYGTRYFVQVTAKVGTDECISNVAEFGTANGTVLAPTFSTPSKDGETLFADDYITVNPQEGVSKVSIEIAASKTFPARSRYIKNLFNGETKTDMMSEVKITGRALTDGKTYYVRARSECSKYGSTSVDKSEYSKVFSFVYSSKTGGVSNIEAVSDAYVTSGAEPVLVISNLTTEANIQLFNIDGTLVRSDLGAETVLGHNEITLPEMPAGAYLLQVNYNNTTKVLKFTKK